MPRSENPRQLFDAVLKQGLGASRGPGGQDCPEAGIIAAYFERSLAAEQKEHWERHFADCARCQAVLAAMARAQTAESAEPRSVRHRGLMPYTAIAAAIAGVVIMIGVIRGLRRPVGLEIASREPLASAERRKTEKSPQAEATGALIALNEARNPPASLGKPASPPLATLEKIPSGRNAERAFGKSNDLVRGVHREKRRRGIRNPEEKAEPAPSVLAPSIATGRPLAESHREEAMKAPSAAPEAPGNAPAAGPEVAGESAERESPPPPPPPAVGNIKPEWAVIPHVGGSAPSAQFAEKIVSGAGGSRETPGAGVVIRTPDNIVRWWLNPKGKIFHRAADGSWSDSYLGAGLMAGSAPSADVCWVVGRGGIIARTIDGDHWQKLASPTSTDLASVAASDAMSAVVTAQDGRRFATSDGGRTWRQL